MDRISLRVTSAGGCTEILSNSSRYGLGAVVSVEINKHK